MNKRLVLALAASATVLAASALFARSAMRAPEPTHAEVVARGKELVSVGGCNHCHTPMVFDDKIGMPVPDPKLRLSGHPAGVSDPEAAPGKQDQAVIGSTFTAFRAPFGVVYAANLTPDVETGLGAWSEQDFVTTVRTGHKKGTGRILLPPMPWQNIAALSDKDLHAMFTYLKSLPPVKNAVPEPKVSPEAIAAIDKSFALAKDVEH